ncbi:EspA/EspE family type VII secretion system effector [Mycolicibacterium sp. XJ662]
MTVLDVFLSTWSNARQTFGSGSPQDGARFDNSGPLRRLASELNSAEPGSHWAGSAADAYGTANTDHQRVIGQIAELDQRLSAHVDESADVVAAGRRDLEAVRQWVLDAAASVPPNEAGQALMLPIVQKGVAQVVEIVQRSNRDLTAVGEKIRALGDEYQTLSRQKFGQRPTGLPPDPDQVLENILKKYQVSEEEMVRREWPWPLNQFKDPQRLTESEARMLDNLSLKEKWDFYQIKEKAEAEAEARYPEGGNIGNHRDAFRHAYWNALMTERFGEEWAREYATAHERKPANTAADEAMDLYNNEIGRSIATANPGASPEQLSDMVHEAVQDGDTVVIRPDGLGLEWSDNIPVGGETGPTDRGPHGPADDPGPMPIPPKPTGDYDYGGVG